MKPSVPGVGSAVRALARLAALTAVVLCSGCEEMPARASAGSACALPGTALEALPAASYRSGLSSDATGGQGMVSLLHPAQIVASGDDLFIADQGLGQLVRVQRASQGFRAIARLPGRVSGMFIDSFRKLYLAVPAVSAVLQVSTEGATERIIRDAANLGNPLDVALDRMQSLHVVDGSDARVIVFDRLGQQTGVLGERLDAPNLFATTNAVAVGQRGVYVLDATLRKVHLFSPGRVSQAHALDATVRAPSALAVDRWDRVFVLDHSPERILVLTDITSPVVAQVSNLGMMQQILDIWVDEMGTLFVAEPGVVRAFQLPAPCPG